MSEIGVAIPTYRSLEALSWVVESVLRQSFADFTLYIFDNSASDGFDDVRNMMSEIRDFRIRYRPNLMNIGARSNFEQCFGAVSSHRYGMVVPADMALASHCLERLRQIAKDSKADIVFPATEATSDFEYAKGKILESQVQKSRSPVGEIEIVSPGALIPDFFGPLNRNGDYGRFGVFGALAHGELFAPISRHKSPFLFHGWEYQKSMMLAAGSEKIALLSENLFVLLTGHERSVSTVRPLTDWTRLEPIPATYQTAVELLREGFVFGNDLGIEEIGQAHYKLLDWYCKTYGNHRFASAVLRRVFALRVKNLHVLRLVYSLVVFFRLRKLRL